MENEKVGIFVRIKDLKEALKPIITDKAYFVVLEILDRYCIIKAYASPHELVGEAVLEMLERTFDAKGAYFYSLPALKDLEEFISEDLENDKCYKVILVFDRRCSEIEVLKIDCLQYRSYYRKIPNRRI